MENDFADYNKLFYEVVGGDNNDLATYSQTFYHVWCGRICTKEYIIENLK